MTFQNPIMLAAMAVIALPVLLHLINLSSARPRRWGAMLFLPEASRPLHRVFTRQTSLLLLRSIMLAALVIAFARPIETGGSKTGTLLTLVLDTSRSMNLVDSGISRLDREKAAALAALSALKPTDRAALVTADTTGEPTADLQSLASRISDLSASRTAVDPMSAITSAAALLNAASPRAGRCCVIGDLSNPGWVSALARTAGKFGDGPVLAMNVGNDGRNDLTLQRLTINTAIGGDFQAAVEVNNTATAARANVRLNWSIDQQVRSRTNVSVAGASVEKAMMPPVRMSPGRHVVSVALPSNIPSTLAVLERVIAVDPPPHILSIGPDGALVAAALPGPAVTWAGDDAALDLAGVDVLVLTGSMSSSPGVSAALPAFVGGGGRVLIIPGDDFDLKSTETMLSTLTDRPPTLAQTATTRPLPRLSRGGKIVAVSHMLNWKASPGRAHEVAPFTGAPPLAFSMGCGRGTVMVAATGFGDQWSSLADSPTLRPWLQVMLNDLCPLLHEIRALHVNEPFATTVAGSVDAHSAAVNTPDGKVEGVVVRRFARLSEMRYPQTTSPGVYRLTYRSAAKPRTLFFSVEPEVPVLPPAPVGAKPATINTVNSVDQLTQSINISDRVPFDGFWISMWVAVAAYAASLLLETQQGRA